MNQIIHADCLEEMRKMEDNSISCIVTDPPYGLHFMGKDWDHGIPGEIYWKEAYRIAKPGSFLLSFGGTRTYHRLTCAIEDSGWEIRDCLMWVFGSGFPKSHNLSQALDSQKHFKEDIIKVTHWIRNRCKELNLNTSDLNKVAGTSTAATHWISINAQPVIPTFECWEKLKLILGECPEWMQKLIKPAYQPHENYYQREILDIEYRLNSPSGIVSCGRHSEKFERKITDSFSELAKQFDGYGTALKPAYEPIIMAMKPCDGTFAQNIKKWGQGGINIDKCRIGNERATKRSKQEDYPKNEDGTEDRSQHWARTGHKENEINKGRWPANVLFDEEAAKMLDEQSGNLKSGAGDKHSRSKNTFMASTEWEKFKGTSNGGDSGGASRFFYCAKTSSRERNEGLEKFPDIECQTGCGGDFPIDDEGNHTDRFKKISKNNHPTVKPLKLMEYLIKLVMPPKDGILLDPFAGSGTTILAAKRLGFNAIGIEKCEEYAKIAAARVDNYIQQMDLF